MKLWLATSNPGKIREITHLLKDPSFEIHSAGELSFYSSPPESGKTFEENAKIKAKSLAAVLPNDWILAEDSGLEVESMGNLPGVHSARYAGPKARDAENWGKLLKMMNLKAVANRKAQFRCVMILKGPGNIEKVFEGKLPGEITKAARGTNGFGYDPIFQPQNQQKTLAEMELAEKNRISHRAEAISKLAEYLKNSVEQSQ